MKPTFISTVLIPCITCLAEAPASFKLDMPVIDQNNPEFDGSGKTWCGPTSGGIAVSYFYNIGYTNFPEDKIAVVKELAKEMKTDKIAEGTKTQYLMEGFKAFAKHYKYKASFETYGIIKNSNNGPYFKKPDMAKVKQDLSEGKLIFIALGYYILDCGSNKYERSSGHWMILSGYDEDSIQVSNPAGGKITTFYPKPFEDVTIYIGKYFGSGEKYQEIPNYKRSKRTLIEAYISVTLEDK